MNESTGTKPKKSNLVVAIILLSLLSLVLAITLWCVYHPPTKVFLKRQAFALDGDSLTQLPDTTLLGEGVHLNPDDFVSDEDAKANVWDYREQMGVPANPTQGYAGIWFDTGKIIDYIRNTFPKLIASMPDLAPKEKWVIAFYWMRKNDPRDSIVKNAFFIIPSKVDTTKGGNTFYDYFTNTGKYYPRKPLVPFTTPTGKVGTALDNGQLYP